METKQFAALILTHGRADNVITYKTLRKQGYTGKIYLIVDDEDADLADYQKNFPNEVVVFSKAESAKLFDVGDNFKNTKGAVVYARNMCFKIAKDLGLTTFIELDDDYTHFSYKFTATLDYYERKIIQLDKVFDVMIKYFLSTPALTIAFAQNGDFIGGKHSGFATELKPRRKAMNTFICSVDRPFQFYGRINEDVTAYVVLGSRGKLFLTIPNVAIAQKTTQKNKGGLTDIYLDVGTYIKSFYTVMYAPSCTKVAEMGDKHRRLHHRIKWNSAVPVILGAHHRKEQKA